MAIVLPDLDVERVKRWCRARVPEQARDQVRLEVTVRGLSVSIHECRPPWNGAAGEWTRTPIARIRYEGDGTWTLYSNDRYGKWKRYVGFVSHQPIGVILEEIGDDPTCIFWG